jgi:hypothetical protein
MIKFLNFGNVTIFILAVLNWYGEGHFLGFFWASLGATLGSVVATSAYWVVSNKTRLPKAPFAAVAIVITALSLIVYAYYAFNGQAENSATSAGQMHIVLMPIMLALISIAGLLLAFATSLLQMLVARDA